MITKRLFLILTILSLGCSSQDKISSREAKNEMSRLMAMALNGDAGQAVQAGEQALKMMDVDVYDYSDSLVKSGEDTFTFDFFDESLQIFEVALAKDPGNLKANAYLALLKPLRSLKGHHWRASGDTSERLIWYYTDFSDDIDGSLRKFFVLKYKTKIHTNFQEQEEIIRPLVGDIFDSMPKWDILKSDPQLDLTLRLPKAFMSQEIVRLRHEDAVTAQNYALAYGIYASGVITYKADSSDWNNKREIQLEWGDEDFNKEYLSDPTVGTLTDPHFYENLKGRSLQVADGTDILVAMLRNRFKARQNDTQDLFHFSQASFSICDHYYDYVVNENVLRPYLLSPMDSMSCAEKNILSPLLLTRWHDPYRDLYENTLNKKSVKDYQKISDYQRSLTESQLTFEQLQKNAKLTRQVFAGPTQLRFLCWTDDSGEHREYETKWVDMPTYLSNPVKDVRVLEPKSYKGTVVWLKDMTVHGLFPEGFPCMASRREHEGVRIVDGRVIPPPQKPTKF